MLLKLIFNVNYIEYSGSEINSSGDRKGNITFPKKVIKLLDSIHEGYQQPLQNKASFGLH